MKKELRNVHRGNKLGEGTFGMVFEGMYKAQLKPGESRIATDHKCKFFVVGRRSDAFFDAKIFCGRLQEVKSVDLGGCF